MFSIYNGGVYIQMIASQRRGGLRLPVKPAAEWELHLICCRESRDDACGESTPVICFLRWAGWGAQIDRQEGNDLFGAVIDET